MTPKNTPDRDGLPADLITEVPEGDAAEQGTPAVPEADDTGDAGYLPPVERGEADPADAWDQALPVPENDDDGYDYDGAADSHP